MELYNEWVDSQVSLPVIDDFDDLMQEILYAYEDRYPIIKTKEGVYIIHKLSIGANWSNYKGRLTKLDPGLYNKLDRFFSIVKD